MRYMTRVDAEVKFGELLTSKDGLTTARTFTDEDGVSWHPVYSVHFGSLVGYEARP